MTKLVDAMVECFIYSRESRQEVSKILFRVMTTLKTYNRDLIREKSREL